MNTASPLINGNEMNLNTSTEMALSDFYRAFNTQNIQLMELSWLNSETISMSNPIGGIRKGWNEIKAGYERIFYGTAKVFVEFYDFSIYTGEDIFFASGRERGSFKNGETEITLNIRTTRIFIKTNGLWKQAHHHGSIDEPELLKTYQKTILK